jgi:peptidoglycan/LPS O-acetylase OafA/YrhL
MQEKRYVMAYLETVLLFFVMVSVYRAKSYLATDQILLQILFGGLFWLFLLNRGHLSRFLNKNWSATLGRYSFAIFVAHIFILDLVRFAIVPRYSDWVIAHNWLSLGMICAATMALAVAVHHFIEAPIARKIKRTKNETDK